MRLLGSSAHQVAPFPPERLGESPQRLREAAPVRAHLQGHGRSQGGARLQDALVVFAPLRLQRCPRAAAAAELVRSWAFSEDNFVLSGADTGALGDGVAAVPQAGSQWRRGPPTLLRR